MKFRRTAFDSERIVRIFAACRDGHCESDSTVPADPTLRLQPRSQCEVHSVQPRPRVSWHRGWIMAVGVFAFGIWPDFIGCLTKPRFSLVFLIIISLSNRPVRSGGKGVAVGTYARPKFYLDHLHVWDFFSEKMYFTSAHKMYQFLKFLRSTF